MGSLDYYLQAITLAQDFEVTARRKRESTLPAILDSLEAALECCKNTATSNGITLRESAVLVALIFTQIRDSLGDLRSPGTGTRDQSSALASSSVFQIRIGSFAKETTLSRPLATKLVGHKVEEACVTLKELSSRLEQEGNGAAVSASVAVLVTATCRSLEAEWHFHEAAVS